MHWRTIGPLVTVLVATSWVGPARGQTAPTPVSVPPPPAAAPPVNGEAVVAPPLGDEPANAAAASTPARASVIAPVAPGTEDAWQPRNSHLLHAGLGTLLGTYVFTALVGFELMAKADSPGETCFNCDKVGPALLIPIAGPWIALPDANPNGGKAVAAIMGVAQATGVVLTAAGLVVYASTGHPHTARGLERLRSVQIIPTRGGVYGGVALVL